MTGKQLTGSFQLMKSLNRSLILNTIRQHQFISRAEIAQITKLTPPTVTNIVNELLEAGLVKESEAGKSRGGRKPILLTIEAKHSYMIGLDVGGHTVRVVLTDLNAEIEAEAKLQLPALLNPELFLNLLTEATKEVIAKADIPFEKLHGIGIGMHGIVNAKHGNAEFAPNFKLSHIPLKQHFEKTFSLPTVIENDARALALGEKWFGNGQGFENLVCVNVGIGIGAGIILNNELFHGRDGIAGEIGHTIVDLNGKQCTCGNYGCLQTVAGGNRLRERALESIAQGQESLIWTEANEDEALVTGELIYRCARKGDKLSIDILAETGRYLGIAIINLIHVLNPERIIVGGGVSKAGHFLLGPLKDTVRQNALTERAKETEIVLSELKDYGTAIGAVTLVLKDIFAIES